MKRIEETVTVAHEGDGALSVLRYVAVGALVFQGAHLIEHVAQLAYWSAHPTQSPWLTPWAAEGRDLLAVGGEIAVGNELLHMLGNLIFFAGLMALVGLCRRAGRTVDEIPHLRTAVLIQGLHVVEHVALTTTSVINGRAIGASTFFGLLDGPLMTSTRIWFHFLLNLVASFYAARALVQMNTVGLIVRRPPPHQETAAALER